MNERRFKLLVVLFFALVMLVSIQGITEFFSDAKAANEKRTYYLKVISLEQGKIKEDILKEKVGGKEECKAELSTSEKAETALWEIFENKDQKYSFKYPQTWELETEEPNKVILKSGEASIIFEFRSGPEAQIEFSDYTLEEKDELGVACQKAIKRSYFGNGSGRLISTSFSVDDTPHLVTVTYEDLGASMTGDIAHAYDLILKTITFD
jgi:hypothetical protein